MSKKKEHEKNGQFCWNELAATNIPAAKKFYSGLLGWKTKPFGKGMEYTLFLKGKKMVGGMVKCSKPGIPSHWIPYVVVEDVDATAKKTAKLRGKVLLEPTNIPTVGRIAVLRDPQGGIIGLITPEE